MSGHLTIGTAGVLHVTFDVLPVDEHDTVACDGIVVYDFMRLNPRIYGARLLQGAGLMPLDRERLQAAFIDVSEAEREQLVTNFDDSWSRCDGNLLNLKSCVMMEVMREPVRLDASVGRGVGTAECVRRSARVVGTYGRPNELAHWNRVCGRLLSCVFRAAGMEETLEGDSDEEGAGGAVAPGNSPPGDE
jgi:hypothetical protein